MRQGPDFIRNATTAASGAARSSPGAPAPSYKAPLAPAKDGQEKEPEFDENDVVRVSTNLITVPAEVLDRNGRYIGNLQKRRLSHF